MTPPPKDVTSCLVQVYKMNFDNAAFKHRMPQQKTAPSYEKLPMKRGIFFDMFPFSVIFRRDMTMYRIGDGLKEVFSDLQGKKVNEEFTLVRPMLEFSWDNVSLPQKRRRRRARSHDPAEPLPLARSTPTSTTSSSCCPRRWWRASRRSTSPNSARRSRRRRRRARRPSGRRSEVALTPFSQQAETRGRGPAGLTRVCVSVRAQEGGGDEGDGPGVQQRPDPVQQPGQLRGGGHRAAGLPDRHGSEPLGAARQRGAPPPPPPLAPQLSASAPPGKCSETIFEDMREPPKKPLHLKGQMKYVPQWDSLIFLGTPM